VPTASPCGECDVCKGITKGATLDVIEIDAASNTGVDNIRDLIERAQFAPVQCRYKVYVIDECLTGDTLVKTREGLMRIDNPHLLGKEVLSYNENTSKWEFKKVLRWLDQGNKQTIVIKTTHREIRCTGNHLIQTNRGWIHAKDLKEGAKILSPVSVDKEAQLSQFIQKDTHQKKINSLPVGSQTWDIHQQPNLIDDLTGIKFTITSRWEQIPAENGWPTSKNIPSLQWITSLERVESVQVAGIERVYDIEVEDNHNFVANGLSVHNCHMLSTAAFNSLLKTLEEPPDRVVFVLATTDPQRVLPTIISRCQRFDFRRIPLESMKNHLKEISIKENITIADDALFLVAQIAQGGLRDAESLLDQLSLLSGEITVEKVWDLVGAVPENDLMALLEALDKGDSQIVLDKVRHLMDRGREPLIVLQNLASFYRDLLIAKTAPNRSDLVALTAPTWEKLSQFSQRWEMNIILAGQKHLQSSEYQIKNTTQPRLWLEITLLGLLPDALKTQAPVVQETRRVSSSPVATPASIPTPTASPTPTTFTSETRIQPTVTETPQNPIQSPPSTGENPPHFEALSGDSDLTEIWQQLLNHLQPLGTQQLFKQHGRLIEFRESFARVAMKSAPLLKIAQDKVVNLEAAFQRLFNRAIRVKLEGPGATESQKGKILPFPTQNRSLKEPFNPNSPNDHPRDQNVGAGSPMSLTNSPNTEPPTIAPSSPLSLTNSPNTEPPTIAPSSAPSLTNSPNTEPPTIAPSSPPSLTNSANTEPPRHQQNDRSVIKNQENAIGLNPEIVMNAAQEVAKLFDGEIVDLKEFSESIPSRVVTGEGELTTELTLPSWNPTTGGQGGEDNLDLGEITIDNPLELDEEDDEMPF
jgi:DNA polymerase-3 subunit gamma/tau